MNYDQWWIIVKFYGLDDVNNIYSYAFYHCDPFGTP